MKLFKFLSILSIFVLVGCKVESNIEDVEIDINEIPINSYQLDSIKILVEDDSGYSYEDILESIETNLDSLLVDSINSDQAISKGVFFPSVEILRVIVSDVEHEEPIVITIYQRNLESDYYIGVYYGEGNELENTINYAINNDLIIEEINKIKEAYSK